MRIENLQNENRKYAKSIENFHVLEYVQDASVSRCCGHSNMYTPLCSQ